MNECQKNVSFLNISGNIKEDITLFSSLFFVINKRTTTTIKKRGPREAVQVLLSGLFKKVGLRFT